jgi:hypothetical protein
MARQEFHSLNDYIFLPINAASPTRLIGFQIEKIKSNKLGNIDYSRKFWKNKPLVLRIIGLIGHVVVK